MFEAITTLFPVVLLLSLAGLSKKIHLSLLVSVVVAALLATQFNIVNAISLLLERFLDNLEIQRLLSSPLKGWNIYICLFIFFLACFYQLTKQAGSIYVYANYVKNKVKSSKRAEMMSLVFSFFLFFDDYLSTLTVGTLMQRVTDKFKISRMKLAFLVSSMSSSLVVLVPFSSWFAAFVSLFRENGIGDSISSSTVILESPATIYFMTIPYMAYPLLTVFVVYYIVLRGISFGKMGEFEKAALEGDLKGYTIDSKKIERKQKGSFFSEEERKVDCRISDFFIPIMSFIFLVFLGLYLSVDGLSINPSDFLETYFPSSACSLFLAAFITSLFTFFLYLKRGYLKFSDLNKVFKGAMKTAGPPIIMILLAWTFGDILSIDLNLGKVFSQILDYSVSLYTYPLLLFFLSALFTFLTGSAWSSAAILLPLFLGVLRESLGDEEIRFLTMNGFILPSLGALFSGCVIGDQLSPISETAIMTSSSVRINLLDHIYSQLTYAIPVAIFSTLSYFSLSFFNLPYTLAYFSLFMLLSFFIIILYLEIMNKYCRVKIKSILK
ncbi:Uncharacterized protein AB751O23_AA_00550 [Chlamydiales bacterium SCGC AB-751-O23]|jgi:tetracycline resistance efflux pump|nr:Uncharacterized protein AB751O23_AA_00550 [Chlamydiales bacterium SCGC AB-751-O23]